MAGHVHYYERLCAVDNMFSCSEFRDRPIYIADGSAGAEFDPRATPPSNLTMHKEFNYANVMQIPGVVKVVVNMGVGEAAGEDVSGGGEGEGEEAGDEDGGVARVGRGVLRREEDRADEPALGESEREWITHAGGRK